MISISKRRRRKEVAGRAFPEAWRRMIRAGAPLCNRLPAEDWAELERHILIFLDEKNFEGCGGLVLTEEMRVVIAARACVLLLHRETDYFPALRSILVYPEPFISKRPDPYGPGVIEEEDPRLGEAWEHGAVVLAWASVEADAADAGSGRNVVLHEFAHVLDFEDGQVDGAPDLDAGASFFEARKRYSAWAHVLKKEFEAHERETEAGQPTVLDGYGATNPAEFFAVSTETFFEQPGELKENHPELYEELKRFYRQDPAGWVGGE